MLDPRLLERLANAIEPLYVKARECVVKEGEAGDTFYVVRSGLLEVVTGPSEERVGYCARGSPRRARVLAGQARTATIRALRDSEVWCLPRGTFDELLASEADFARTMVRALTRLVFESRQRQTRPGPRVIAIVPLHPDTPTRDLVDAFNSTRAHDGAHDAAATRLREFSMGGNG